MSWSVSAKGKDAAQVKESIAKDFDLAAANYDSQNPEEAADIRAAKERTLSGIDACKFNDAYADGDGKPMNGVVAYAYGSRSSWSATFTVSVSAAHVED